MGASNPLDEVEFHSITNGQVVSAYVRAGNLQVRGQDERPARFNEDRGAQNFNWEIYHTNIEIKRIALKRIELLEEYIRFRFGNQDNESAMKEKTIYLEAKVKALKNKIKICQYKNCALRTEISTLETIRNDFNWLEYLKKDPWIFAVPIGFIVGITTIFCYNVFSRSS